MNGFSEALATAVSLIGGFHTELRAIVLLSLGVSLTASTSFANQDHVLFSTRA
jgi:hypothetical protein